MSLRTCSARIVGYEIDVRLSHAGPSKVKKVHVYRAHIRRVLFIAYLLLICAISRIRSDSNLMVGAVLSVQDEPTAEAEEGTTNARHGVQPMHVVGNYNINTKSETPNKKL